MNSGSERRSGERRQAERRQILPPTSVRGRWAGDVDFQDPQQAAPTDTAPARTQAGAAESSLISRDARAPAQPPGTAVARIVRTYWAARVALGVALVGAQAAVFSLGANVSPLVMSVCALYALQVGLPWLAPGLWSRAAPMRPTPIRRRQWLLTVGVDLLAFGLLHVLDAGASFNYAALLVLPVLMSGVLTTRRLALGTAAGVALLLLAVTLRSVGGLTEGAAVLAQSGLAGMGLFVIAFIASELAGRMTREEQSARGSREAARQQAQLNRLVIEEMADGVLVLDRHLRVRAANPAARQLLVLHGLAPVAPFALRDLTAAAPLCDLVDQALAEEQWPDAGRDLQLNFANNHKRSLRMRVRFTRGAASLDGQVQDDSAGAGDGLCVVLLEDARTAQARLRQEKLAAMGRVSAGIAHEIRNPLAAIAQANQLMLEELQEVLQEQRHDGQPAVSQMKLGQLIADNVKRLQRIVDDVLELAPGAQAETRAIDVTAATRTALQEWAQTLEVSVGFHERDDARVRLDVPSTPLLAVFDPEHLRRVLVNLLDNALRHSTPERHALLLRLAAREDGSVVLSLANDGPPIAADVEPYLFEPFFSTRSRGSGLGLYICRELCERYGASIEFRARSPQDRYRNGFVVVMRGDSETQTQSQSQSHNKDNRA
jgi:two-component system, NtrC family, sensor histidine kinase PilS